MKVAVLKKQCRLYGAMAAVHKRRERKSSDTKDWVIENDKLVKEFTFPDFPSALSFLLRVGFEAEKQNHHPEIFNVWNKVTLKLCTHDAGNSITEKDYALAEAVEEIVR